MVAKQQDVLVLGLKKVHVIVGALVAIVTPSVVVTAGFYKAKTELNDKINAVQLQNVSTFAKTEDVKAMDVRLIQIQSDVSEIKGEIRGAMRAARRHQRSENGE